MNRRNFMAGILAAATAPAFVRAGSLMRVDPRIVVPELPLFGFQWGESPADKYLGRFIAPDMEIAEIGTNEIHLSEKGATELARSMLGGLVVIGDSLTRPEPRRLYRGRN